MMQRRAQRLLVALSVLAACKPDASDDDGADTGTTAADPSSGGGEDSSSSSTAPLDDSSDSGTDSDGGTDTGTEAIDCDAVPVITYDTFGKGFLASYCNGCHGGHVVDRQDAPASAVFDTHEQVLQWTSQILARRTPPEGVMPMPPNGGVTPDDDERLRIWLTCWP
ncbi:MAG: hypothetical protein IPH07_37595 [Deltaproteobacteria bacterium]|nr:hypothetical protein [Deltaproteobacteria bacterium]MBK8235908.1 hypothetical protein [Deltaproteobacteria bacterium]MBK8713541.1 hypothetical protein [Deltaproteobacteria bacterium]MBP7289674.1 hypothetical protein [Nannocystaceae bacterium]